MTNQNSNQTMTPWLQTATAAIQKLRRIYPTLAKIPCQPDRHADTNNNHQRIAEPALPIDPRPIDLANDTKKFAENYLKLSLGTLTLGTKTPQLFVNKLAMIATLLPQVVTADPQLANEIFKQTRRLLKRYDALLSPTLAANTPAWEPITTPCPECAGHLFVIRTDWHIQCDNCGAAWTIDDLRLITTIVKDDDNNSHGHGDTPDNTPHLTTTPDPMLKSNQLVTGVRPKTDPIK